MTKQEALKYIMDLPDKAEVNISRDLREENKRRVEQLVRDIWSAYNWSPGESWASTLMTYHSQQIINVKAVCQKFIDEHKEYKAI